MEPLKEWVCDKCHDLVDIKGGWVEWVNDDGKRNSFHIVHKASKCFHHTNAPGRQDMHLDAFLGIEGLQHFLAMLDVGPIIDPKNSYPVLTPDMRSFVDTVRRLHIPYYEEARLYFQDEFSHGEFGGVNEVAIFTPDYCKAIIETYERQHN